MAARSYVKDPSAANPFPAPMHAAALHAIQLMHADAKRWPTTSVSDNEVDEALTQLDDLEV